MSKKGKREVMGEDDKRIIRTPATPLSEEELKAQLEELEGTTIEKIYVGEKPPEQSTTRLGNMMTTLISMINEDPDLAGFMARLRKRKAMLLCIEDRKGEVHGMVAGGGEIRFYNGKEGYDVVVRMYEDTFLDLILGTVDVNYAFSAGYILFEGRNWLLHSEILRTMFSKFRKAVKDKGFVGSIRALRG